MGVVGSSPSHKNALATSPLTSDLPISPPNPRHPLRTARKVNMENFSIYTTHAVIKNPMALVVVVGSLFFLAAPSSSTRLPFLFVVLSLFRFVVVLQLCEKSTLSFIPRMDDDDDDLPSQSPLFYTYIY